MRLHTWKDRVMNALLVLLVITSVVLSLQIWYPTDQISSLVSTGPSVQPQPTSSEQQMPDIFRPEMILLRQKENRIAPIHTGSLPYKQVWPQVSEVLTGLPINGGAFQVDRVPDRLQEEQWIQVRLPTAIMLSQWADLWKWNTTALRNGSMRVDRVTFYLGQPGAIYLSGPVGVTMHLGDLSDERGAQLLQVIQEQDPGLFIEHRSLDLKEGVTRIHRDVVVPVINEMPIAQMRIAAPNERDEEARYFPDLSVVRQIDEQDARSLTDGQRLLRFTAAGLLEYRTADPANPSATPDMRKAITLAQEWVASRGGWPQEIVLRRYVQQPGRAMLEFDFRSGGPFPVESLGPAVQVHVSAQRVVYFSRYPAFVEMRFHQEQQPIISPEAAVQWAVDQVSMLMLEPIRSMHLAYVAKAKPKAGPGRWELEPTWVIQAGESRIYVSATEGKDKAPPHLIR